MIRVCPLFIFPTVLLAALGGCSSHDEVPVYAPPETIAPRSAQSEDAANIKLSELELERPGEGGALRFRPQDQIRMTVWGYPELEHVAEVQPNGKLTLPLVGEVEASGRSAEEIRTNVEEKLQSLSTPASPELRYGDLVTMYVWQYEKITYTAVVQPDGTVTLPLAGTMRVVGRSLPDMNLEFNQRLAVYIKNPKAWLIPQVSQRMVMQDPVVSILPVKLTQRRATVLGEVYAPGLQPITPDTRVMDLLAGAQLAETGNLDSVILIRHYNSARPLYRRLEMRKFLDGESPMQNIFIQEGDILFVPKTGIAKVGFFIDSFFAKTKPLFDWYIAAANAYNYQEIYKLNKELNEAARDAFRNLTVPPSIP